MSSICANVHVRAQVKVRAKTIIDGRLNANIVGQSIVKLAKIFDIKCVPRGCLDKSNSRLCIMCICCKLTKSLTDP